MKNWLFQRGGIVTDKQNEDAHEWEEQFQTARDDLEIHYARYGSDTEKRDVIHFIKARLSPHSRLNLLVNSANLGGDYYPGNPKQLHIIYTFNGVLYEERLDEGEMLVIPKLLIIETAEPSTLLDSVGIAAVVVALFWGISRIVKVFRDES